MSASVHAPQIVLGINDHRQLVELATASEGTPAAEALLDELERAKVVADDRLPATVVRMGSRVRFRSPGAGEKLVELVYPVDADIAAGRISVLTPVGAALIGLSGGQSISWETRDGREQELTVVEVRQPG
jgi:regulator of nucleoside diphosphate kinase